MAEKLSIQTLTDGLTPVVAFSYADAANRVADTNRTPPTIALAVGKVALQVDTGHTYRVASLGPLVWVRESPNPVQIVTVAEDNSGDYSSVGAAVAAISDASSSKPYVVRVAPGIYSESPFSMKSYVMVSGYGGPQAVVLQTDDNNAHFITGASASWLGKVSLDGPTGVGFAAYYHTEESLVPAFLDTVLIRKGYYGVCANPAAARGVIHAMTVGNEYAGTVMNQFMRATGFGTIVALRCAHMNGPTGALTHSVFAADGANAEIYLDLCIAKGDATTVNGLFLDNGAFSRAVACSFTRGVNAIHIGSGGSGTTLEAAGVAIRDSQYTKDIWIESVSAVVSFNGVADKAKITDVGATFSATFSDVTAGEEGTVTVGEVWAGTLAESVPLATLARELSDTGWFSGGIVTVNAGLDVDISAGTGWFNTGTGVIRVEWSLVTALTLGAGTGTYIYVNASGVVSTSAGLPTGILLGLVETDGSGVIVIHDIHVPAARVAELLNDYLESTRSIVVDTGLAGGAGSTATKFDVDAGTYFREMHPITYAGVSDATFRSWWDTDGAGTSSGDTDTDEQWDNAGTLTGLAASQWKADTIYLCSDGSVHLIYGTATHASQVLAEAAEIEVTNSIIERTAISICSLIIQQGVGIVNVVDRRPVANAAAGGGSATDHGGLSGLADDDHSQYLLVSGSRAMGGDLDLGTNDVTNVGLVDGVDVSAHTARHLEGGADPIANATTSAKGIVELATDGEAAAGVVVQGDDSRLIFGTDFSQTVSAGRTTTGAGTPQPKATLVTPALVAGRTYRVAWNCVLDATKFARPACRLYNVTAAGIIGALQEYETQEATDRQSMGAFAYLTGLTGAQTLEVQFYAVGASGTAGIEDAHIEMWRVS